MSDKMKVEILERSGKVVVGFGPGRVMSVGYKADSNVKLANDIALRWNAHEKLVEACRAAMADITSSVNYEEKDPQALKTVGLLESALSESTKEN